MNRILFLVILCLFIMGCGKSPTYVKTMVPVSEKQKPSTPNTKPSDATVEPSTQLRNDGMWVQLGHRLYYVQGIVERMEKNAAGQDVLTLRVEKTFQSEPDGVKTPYENDKTYRFIMKNQTNHSMEDQRVILYGGQVTSKDQDQFIGAIMKYYESNNTFIDSNGKKAVLPPQEFPFQF